jgi:hypothetical protein
MKNTVFWDATPCGSCNKSRATRRHNAEDGTVCIYLIYILIRVKRARYHHDMLRPPVASAVPQLSRLVAGFPPRRPGFEPRPSDVGFVVDKAELGQVLSEYFGFPCQSLIPSIVRNHHLSSRALIIGQEVTSLMLDLVRLQSNK